MDLVKVFVSFCVIAGDEWKLVADTLGLTPPEIRFLEHHGLNPFHAVLSHISRQRRLTVGELYDLLSDCGFPVLADLL